MNFSKISNYDLSVSRALRILSHTAIQHLDPPFTMAAAASVADELAACREEVAQLHAERETTETVFAQLEQQFTSLSATHAAVVAERDRLAAANAALEARVTMLQASAAAATAKAEDALAAAHRMELATRNAREERDAATASSDLKQRELDRLSGAQCPRLSGGYDARRRAWRGCGLSEP